MKRGYARKVDENQAEIVEALKAAGCTILDCSGVGCGMPDIIVGRAGHNYLIEIKNPKAKGKLNQRQLEWHATWKGTVAIVYSVAQALYAVGISVKEGKI